jgi:hypothetical protein
VARTRKLQVDVPLVIGEVDQLRAFAATPAFVLRRPVILSIPGMSPPEAFAAAERLNKDRNECGCALSAQAMTAAFLIVLALLAIRYGLFTLALLERLPIAIVAAVVFAALGKIVGIAIGRKRARREVARILATFANRA